MTTLAVAPDLLDPVGGEPTLDELLVDAWEGLAADRVVRCLVCGEMMAPEHGSRSTSLGGRCEGCGSRLY